MWSGCFTLCLCGKQAVPEVNYNCSAAAAPSSGNWLAVPQPRPHSHFRAMPSSRPKCHMLMLWQQTAACKPTAVSDSCGSSSHSAPRNATLLPAATHTVHWARGLSRPATLQIHHAALQRAQLCAASLHVCICSLQAQPVPCQPGESWDIVAQGPSAEEDTIDSTRRWLCDLLQGSHVANSGKLQQPRS